MQIGRGCPVKPKVEGTQDETAGPANRFRQNGRVSQLNIEIWADIACPFCYIGKRNFEKGLELARATDDAEVTYRSFQLDPDAPRRQDFDVYEMLARKTGRTREDAVEMNRHVSAMAAAAGLEFDFESLILANTFDAHRVLKLGVAARLGSETMDILMSAYFCEGLDVGDHQTLVSLGIRAGLDETAIRTELQEGNMATEVWSDVIAAQGFGISAVPAFVFDRKALLSGAQAPEGFAEAIGRMKDAADPLTIVRGGPEAR